MPSTATVVLSRTTRRSREFRGESIDGCELTLDGLTEMAMSAEHPTVLLINDEEELQQELGGHLRRWGFRVEGVRTGKEGLSTAERVKLATAVVDVVLPDMEGLEVLRRIRIGAPATPVIILSAFGHIRLVVDAMRLGAWDFLTKPVDPQQMHETVRGAMAYRAGETSHARTLDWSTAAQEEDELLWINEKMEKISRQVDQLANTDATVLIRGETGVGKELVARALHWRSKRRSRPWAKVNCAALPAELVESELFGYEKGAFTGAHRRKPGRFEQADGGTVLLDEIGEMPLSTQAKLLHVLQDGEFTPLGGGRSVKVDVRVVGSTNQDLERGLETGTFRKDLYYRLNVVTIWIPPLRERREEIPLLANYFWEKFTRQYGLQDFKAISPELMEQFLAYDWPGNVRELENVIKRIIVLGDEAGLLDELARHAGSRAKVTGEELKPNLFSLKKVARQAALDAERVLIQQVLTRVRWNRMAAARQLGISYKALLYKIQACGLSLKN